MPPADDPRGERIAHVIDELRDLPVEEREARIAELSENDREAVWEAELEDGEKAIPDDYDDLGAGD